MIRLLGVLVGSALAVAALVVFVGIPEFTTELPVAEPAVITLPMRGGAAATAGRTAEPGQAPTAAAGAQAEPLPEPPPGPVTEPDTDATTEPVTAQVAAEAPPAPETVAADSVAALHWYAFWSPFRSEVAANGFVEQLQRVTGLDYRVVKVKSGVYEVAFAYEDDHEITANLSQISAATGLELPES